MVKLPRNYFLLEAAALSTVNLEVRINVSTSAFQYGMEWTQLYPDVKTVTKVHNNEHRGVPISL